MINLRMFIETEGMVYRGIYDQNWYRHPEYCILYREIKQRDHIFPVMVGTGKKDKNGIEIFAGDIVRQKFVTDIFPEKFDERIGSVIWSEGHCGFAVAWTDEVSFTMDIPQLEVIGNIYESSELVK